MAINLSDNILAKTTAPADAKYGPYSGADLAAAKAAACSYLDSSYRYEGLTVGLLVGANPVVEYWFSGGVLDANLVLKTSGSAGSSGAALDVQSSGTSIVDPAAVLNFRDDDFTVTSPNAGEAYVEAFRYQSDIVVSLSGGKTFGRYEDGDTIPANGLTPAEVIVLALAEPIAPTVGLSSSTSVNFNQTAISNVLNFSHVINSAGATVSSAVLEWRRGNTGSWTTLSTSLLSSGTFTHTLTDTAFNPAVFNYRYTVTDSQSATNTALFNITPIAYVAPSISLSITATSTTSPETDLSREVGNISTVLSGSITRNSPLVDLVDYTLQYSANGGSWTDIGTAVSIGPGSSSISTITHNNVALNTSTTIAYRVKVTDIYQVTNGGNGTVNYYYLQFYGPSSSAPTDSTAVRALPSRAFSFVNPVTLFTGSVEKIFTIAIPASQSVTQVLDLDALNANITANYVLSTFNVNDAGGTAVSYKVYTMTNAVPYSSGGTPPGNHRHQITK